MSKTNVVMIKTMAIPTGLDNTKSGLVGETVNPVMEGEIIMELINRIAETMFNMNKGVSMFI